MHYIYTIDGGSLSECPACGADLTVDGGIAIELTDGTVAWEIPSCLTDGELVDVGGMVAAGFHSATKCGVCGAQLIDFDDVQESQGEPEPELVSLVEHDQAARDRYEKFKNGKPPNGIACPLCGKELVDTDPCVQYLSYPPRTPVECLSCKWSGNRIA